MKHRTLLSCVLFTLGANAVALAGQSRQWVVADVAGRERVAFVPRPEPYSTGGPAVSVPVPGGQVVRLPSGESVRGFEFIGWREGEAIRVVVRALIPREEDSSTTPRRARDRFERRQIATVPIRPGETLAVERIRELGMTPVELRLVER